MASSDPTSQAASTAKPTAQETSRPGSSQVPASAPVEMETIQTAPLDPLPPPVIPQTSTTSPVVAPIPEPSPAQSQLPSTDDEPVITAKSAEHPVKADLPTTVERLDSDGLGPASEAPAVKPDPASGPVVIITLLLTASGARHPYKIDEKYLKKRNVKVEGMDPYNISVYTLKELIWRDWREEWEQRPTSPSSIRLIHFGRMLDDKVPLKECRFQTEAPNVVHMTVKPQEVVDEEDAKTGKGGSRRDGDEEEHAGCRCVIL